jgi:AcrR family transcriptional regulator
MANQDRGIQTRDRILRKAVQLASTVGLDGLSLGDLAKSLNLSKAGLFAHFGSKESLQLAVIEEARRVFADKVIEPSASAPEGLPRLFALQMNWIVYLRDATFRGGCFFASASHEFDGRPGVVRSRIAVVASGWRARLEAEAERANELGHIVAETHPARLAFLLHAITLEANWAQQLLGETEALDVARDVSEYHLRHAATPEGLRATKSRRVISAGVHTPAD